MLGDTIYYDCSIPPRELEELLSGGELSEECAISFPDGTTFSGKATYKQNGDMLDVEVTELRLQGRKDAP